MTHAFITVVAPLSLAKLTDAQHAIESMGNPCETDISQRLGKLDDEHGIHFASMHAVPSPDGDHAWLVLEFSADGSEEVALDRFLGAVNDELRTIFTFASDWKDGRDLRTYLLKHKVVPGCGWFADPGVVFTGTPGMTVGRILREARLAMKVTALLGLQPGSMSGLERLDAVRKALATNGEFKEALSVGDAEPPYIEPSTTTILGILFCSFAKTYLWPAGLVVIAAMLVAGFSRAHGVTLFWPAAGAFALGAAHGLIVSLVLTLVLTVAAAGAAYILLRRQETQDWVDERPAGRATVAEIFKRENRCAQNHMISVTRRKPGALRVFTSRLVFWAVGEFASKIYRPGFLSDIGTIHFARWVTVPGSRDLLFLSNYDASWESYLEDFITRAHTGLTGIWSNSIGFPRSENLVQKGATDGERFKRYARRSMVPTRFWYSAYPNLTTSRIRANAEIRRGLSGAMTEDEAQRWLALFGSAARPASKLVSTEIQSLMFGGLKFMPFGTCLFFQLCDDKREAAKEWLRTLLPHVAFNDGRRLRVKAIVTLCLTANGLKRLGLPDEGLSTFPFAYLEGMTAEYRARILGDRPGVDSQWAWDDRRFDAALLVYGTSKMAVANLSGKVRTAAKKAGMGKCHVIQLVEVDAEKKTEPFGFVDGISQPVIRGTYKGLRQADPIHLVEPGEFILGYPDNRGSIPPGPTLPAIADPENRLSLVEAPDDFDHPHVDDLRDLGKNGSFLVIRQLEQDVEGFDRYCAEEADRLAKRLPPPYVISADFIAAKMVGRWKDGSSLIRHPYAPQSVEQAKAKETARPQAKVVATIAPVAAAPKATRGADNDFLFGSEDPEGLRCPFGAHIRRANPRDSLDPGSADQVAITNRHRIIRVGRLYQQKKGRNSGLLFMCLNGDIERQFEFIQQTWLKRPSFHGLSCEKDPLLGDAEEGTCSYTIPSREGPVLLAPMPAFIKTLGGGYFFLPGKRLIEYLAG